MDSPLQLLNSSFGDLQSLRTTRRFLHDFVVLHNKGENVFVTQSGIGLASQRCHFPDDNAVGPEILGTSSIITHRALLLVPISPNVRLGREFGILERLWTHPPDWHHPFTRWTIVILDVEISSHSEITCKLHITRVNGHYKGDRLLVYRFCSNCHG